MWARTKCDITVGTSSPKYPRQERGICFVIGTHPCWHDDYVEALTTLGVDDYAVCAVNDAVELILADHIATCHGEKIEQFIEKHAHRWPDEPLPTIHLRDVETAKTERSAYRWPVKMGASSAIFAAAVMVMIGYEKVILCGCPLAGGGGYANKTTHASTPDDPRIGFISPDSLMLQAWHDAMYHAKDDVPEITEKIRSMSGKTKQIFGGI